LETSGLLTVTEDVVSGKRRKNFRITPSGKRLLTEARSKLKELASEIIDDKDARQSRESKSKKG
jgi:DNA-binding PadR family transcriptional regulator